MQYPPWFIKIAGFDGLDLIESQRAVLVLGHAQICVGRHGDTELGLDVV